MKGIIASIGYIISGILLAFGIAGDTQMVQEVFKLFSQPSQWPNVIQFLVSTGITGIVITTVVLVIFSLLKGENS